MARTPMVSVCMASYNHARFLPAALDGILGQTFRDFELIVVDDGSTDNSLEILQCYARKCPGIMRVFTHPDRRNLGSSVSYNLAIQEACGVYWCVHDSDDVVYPDTLERVVAFMESHPDIGWAYGVSDYIDKDGTRLDRQYGYDLSTCPDLVEELILTGDIAPKMVRMKCIAEMGPLEPGLIRGEWEFVIRLAARYPAAFLPGAVGAYRVHDHNTSITLPQHATPERILKALRDSLEVFTTLSRKADTAEGRFFGVRTKALFDFIRAVIFVQLKDREAASLAVAAVFRRDPSFGYDLKRLAYYLNRYRSLWLALMVIREFGYHPNWLFDKDFMSTLLRLGVLRIRHQFKMMRRLLKWDPRSCWLN